VPAAAAAAPARLASYIDHTLLRPDAPAAAMERLVAEAAEHLFAAVCLPPVYVAMAARALAGTPVRTGTVVGFPLGYPCPGMRVEESRRAVADGAEELDTVLNLSWLKGREDQRVLDDLAAWVAAARAERDGLTLKVILETSLLTDEEKVRAACLAAAAGADFVKTSTGFAPSAPAAGAGAATGATVEDVALLVRTVGPHLGVKAAGGIRTAAAARTFLAAGARRLGTSASLAILRQDSA
jgi:deoxyribose-phosphate aldolase